MAVSRLTCSTQDLWGGFIVVHRFSGCGMQAQKLGAQAAECRALAVAANGLSGCGTQAPDQAAQWWCCVGLVALPYVGS